MGGNGLDLRAVGGYRGGRCYGRHCCCVFWWDVPLLVEELEDWCESSRNYLPGVGLEL